MSGSDWFRSSRWDDRIAAEFEAKLARARSQKAQYLKIQAGCLSKSQPDVALMLIERYFETGDQLFVAEAHAIRATAYEAIDRAKDALAEYKQALHWEEANPQILSQAWCGFCKLVAEQKIQSEYDFALAVLGRDTVDCGGPFPSGRYIWNGCNALIAEDLGEFQAAKQFADAALRAAREQKSPFAFHKKLGLVGKAKTSFLARLEAIAK